MSRFHRLALLLVAALASLSTATTIASVAPASAAGPGYTVNDACTGTSHGDPWVTLGYHNPSNGEVRLLPRGSIGSTRGVYLGSPMKVHAMRTAHKAYRIPNTLHVTVRIQLWNGSGWAAPVEISAFNVDCPNPSKLTVQFASHGSQEHVHAYLSAVGLNATHDQQGIEANDHVVFATVLNEYLAHGTTLHIRSVVVLQNGKWIYGKTRTYVVP
jgi:hypothetical protein